MRFSARVLLLNLCAFQVGTSSVMAENDSQQLLRSLAGNSFDGAATAGRALADSVTEDKTSKLYVTSPHHLSSYYHHTTALFGEPRYGRSHRMDLPLIYIEKKDLEARGCQGYHLPEITEPAAFLFLWDDKCDLVGQAQLAQSQGAAAVLYGLDRCQCDAKDTPAFAKFCSDQPCRGVIPVLVQNRERHVDVPVVVIAKLDALRLADCYLTSVHKEAQGTGVQCKHEEVIRIDMLWAIPQMSDNKVHWSLFTTPDSKRANDMTKALKRIAVEVHDRGEFEPHFLVSNTMGCTGHQPGTEVYKACALRCTDNGMYCLPVHLEPPKMGKVALLEGLYMKALWTTQVKHKYVTDREMAEKWWDVMAAFTDVCRKHGEDGDRSELMECIQHVHKEYGFNYHVTKLFVKALSDTNNEVFQNTVAAQLQMHVYSYPSVAVNHVTLRGEVSPTTVVDMLCTSYHSTNQPLPKLCEWVEEYEYGTVLNLNEYFNDAPEGPSGDGGVGSLSATSLFFVIVSAIAMSSIVVLGVYKAFRYHNDRGLREEMHNIMERYVPMSDVDSQDAQQRHAPTSSSGNNGSVGGSGNGYVTGNSNGSTGAREYHRPVVSLDTDALFGPSSPAVKEPEPTAQGSYQAVHVERGVEEDSNGQKDHPLTLH